MIGFLKHNWIAIVATLGLIQPWLTGIWKKLFFKGIPKLYPSGSIEVGFSELGPTVGLQGTIKAENKDVFITYMELRVTKLKNKEEHKFIWAAFRPLTISFGRPLESFEIPASLIIKEKQPYKFSIVFSDVDTQNEILPFVENCRNELFKFQQEVTVDPTKTQEQRNIEIFGKYKKSAIVTKAYSDTRDKIYWEKGTYKLDIIIHTEKRNFIYYYKFDMTDRDYELIKLNALTITENPLTLYLKVGGVPYNFASCNYKAIK